MDHVLQFDPPLPCGTIEAGGTCGKPATVGLVSGGGGSYLLLPICADCTRAVSKIYQVQSLDLSGLPIQEGVRIRAEPTEQVKKPSP